jgi:hypothetical protein
MSCDAIETAWRELWVEIEDVLDQRQRLIDQNPVNCRAIAALDGRIERMRMRTRRYREIIRDRNGPKFLA